MVLGSDSEPLDVGRKTRTIPSAIRRAIEQLYDGCAWPGCHAPLSWCDIHHNIHWADGGETSVDNCCPYLPQTPHRDPRTRPITTPILKRGTCYLAHSPTSQCSNFRLGAFQQASPSMSQTRPAAASGWFFSMKSLIRSATRSNVVYPRLNGTVVAPSRRSSVGNPVTPSH